jgi:hypothetical protein
MGCVSDGITMTLHHNLHFHFQKNRINHVHFLHPAHFLYSRASFHTLKQVNSEPRNDRDQGIFTKGVSFRMEKIVVPFGSPWLSTNGLWPNPGVFLLRAIAWMFQLSLLAEHSLPPPSPPNISEFGHVPFHTVAVPQILNTYFSLTFLPRSLQYTNCVYKIELFPMVTYTTCNLIRKRNECKCQTYDLYLCH